MPPSSAIFLSPPKSLATSHATIATSLPLSPDNPSLSLSQRHRCYSHVIVADPRITSSRRGPRWGETTGCLPLPHHQSGCLPPSHNCQHLHPPLLCHCCCFPCCIAASCAADSPKGTGTRVAASPSSPLHHRLPSTGIHHCRLCLSSLHPSPPPQSTAAVPNGCLIYGEKRHSLLLLCLWLPKNAPKRSFTRCMKFLSAIWHWKTMWIQSGKKS